jgi:hypothetical protein
LKYNKEIKYKIEFSEHLNKDYILEKQYFYWLKQDFKLIRQELKFSMFLYFTKIFAFTAGIELKIKLLFRLFL